MGCVYCVTFPNSKKYVGVTKHTAERRFDQHKREAVKNKTGRLFLTALRKYGPDNCKLEVLFSNSDMPVLKQTEIDKIAELNTLYPNGYNSTIGGDGVSGLIPEVWEKTLAKMRATKATPEYIAKQREVQAIVWDKEMCDRRSNEIREMWKDPVYRQNMVDKHTGYVPSEQQRSKLSVSSTAMWADPVKREEITTKLQAAWLDDKTKDNHRLGMLKAAPKIAIKAKQVWENPEYKEMMRQKAIEYQNRPEIKEKKSETTKKQMENSDNRFRIACTLSQYTHRMFIKCQDKIDKNKDKTKQCLFLSKMDDPFTFKAAWYAGYRGKNLDRLVSKGWVRVIDAA